MSALKELIDWADTFGMDVSNARTEFAQLRATVAEQARQLAEAANIMATVSLEADPEIANPTVRRYAIDMCDSWLAAHPAPTADEAQP